MASLGIRSESLARSDLAAGRQISAVAVSSLTTTGGRVCAFGADSVSSAITTLTLEKVLMICSIVRPAVRLLLRSSCAIALDRWVVEQWCMLRATS